MACPTLMASSNYSPFGNASSNNIRFQCHVSVMDIGRNGLAVGKVLKRQLTKYLNECRNREGDGIETNTALKVKPKSNGPPPVPDPDYTGSISDDSESCDGGWDTDFDDDDFDDADYEDEEEEKKLDASGYNEDLLEKSQHSNGVQRNLIASLINRFESKQVNSNFTQKQESSPLRSGSSTLNNPSEAETLHDMQAVLPRRKPMPSPPTHPVVLPKSNPRPPSMVTRPQQQPPPPPPRSATTTITTIPLPSPELNCDNHEDITPAQSEAIVIDSPSLSGNGISSSSRSTSHGNLDSLNQKVDSMNLKEDELKMDPNFTEDEDYEMPNDKKWLTSSRTSLTSVASSRPELPPKNMACRELPPPLPEKPRGKIGVASGLSRKGTPALPQRSSDDGELDSRNFKSMLGNLFSTIGKPKRDRCLVKDGFGIAEHDTTPAVKNSSMSKSSSLTSLVRPLPPVPNGHLKSMKTRTRASVMVSPRNSPQNLATINSPQILAPNSAHTSTRNSLDGQPWFHRVEREVAEAMLKSEGQRGSYLVRESKRAGENNPYTLTIFYDDKISHLNIRIRSDGKYALGKEKGNEKPFNSVEELISFHQNEPILLTARGQRIGETNLVCCPPK